MKNKIGISALVLLAMLNLLVVWDISVIKAVFSTFVGLFFSVSWLYVFGKILDDKNGIDDQERAPAFKEYVYLIGPGFSYYLIVWSILLAIYVYA